MRSVSRMICVQLRFSLSFSMPRWRYPMTTSASTTFSPSRRKTTLSTPCVLGCCGPMLITSSSVSNIGPCCGTGLLNVGLLPRLAQLQPVQGILEQHLARSFERIVFSLRMSLPFLRHQDPAQVRVPCEADAEHVVHLAFEPVRSRPHDCDRVDRHAVGNP